MRKQTLWIIATIAGILVIFGFGILAYSLSRSYGKSGCWSIHQKREAVNTLIAYFCNEAPKGWCSKPKTKEILQAVSECVVNNVCEKLEYKYAMEQLKIDPDKVDEKFKRAMDEAALKCFS